MSTLGERLRHARKLRGYSQLLVSVKTRISNFNISNYERGTREPDAETLAKLADFYGVSIDYLITGDGGHSDNIAEPVLRVSSHHRDIAHNRRAPIVAEISCGTPMYTEDRILDYFPLNPMMVNPFDGPYVWLKAKGDSMINVRIFEGSLVLIRIQSTVDSGDIAAVCIDEDNATLKRVFFLADGIMLAPENPSMSSTVYSPERVRIVGKAVSVVSNL